MNLIGCWSGPGYHISGIGDKVEFSRLGRLIQAAIVFTYAIPASGVIWTWDKILTLVLMVVCGALIFFGLFLIYAFLLFTIEVWNL